MKWSAIVLGLACLGSFLLGAGDVRGETAEKVVAWGNNYSGQGNVPAPNADFVAVAAGEAHSLGLKSDRTIVGWGDNRSGECNVPAPNAEFVAVAAGGFHSLGLKSDGTIVAWGDNGSGQSSVPGPNVNFVAVAAGLAHSLGLKSNGTIVAWGHNLYHQCDVPAPNADFVAVAAGYTHSLGIKSNGTIVAWGYPTGVVPAPNADFVAVAGGEEHHLGLKSNGTIVAWGDNSYHQCNIPAPNADFVAVSAGWYFSLGLKSDGRILAWGNNHDGQCNVPAPNAGFMGLAGGELHGLGLKRTAPAIEAIGDLPNDQGRQVRLTWARSPLDLAGEPTPISEYAIYRKITMVPGRTKSLLAWPHGNWDYVTSVPARTETDYSVIVPTLADSTIADGMAYSTFFVSARTGDPATFYVSNPDSGYSVDNLAPAPPTLLRFAGPNLLAWLEAEESDFNYFTVYGSSSPAPDLTMVRLVQTSRAQASVVQGTYAYYHVTVTDVAGNAGLGASINDPLVTPVGPGSGIPARFALLPSRPNPTRGATVIRFDLPTVADVEIRIYDPTGRAVAVLTRRPYPPGPHEVGWAGTDAAGKSLVSGAYFLRIQAGTFSATQRILLAK